MEDNEVCEILRNAGREYLHLSMEQAILSCLFGRDTKQDLLARCKE